MFLRHNPRSFLTGDDPFVHTRELDASSVRVDQEVIFENRHEGFMGIPHGGIAMGMCLDAWDRIGERSYPIRADFRFGGSGVGIGDPVVFSLERPGNDGIMVTQLMKPGDKRPYLKATMQRMAHAIETAPVGLPPAEHQKLPYYRNCFVCGHHRTEPGLQRRFRVHTSEGGFATSAQWGWESDDPDRGRMFLTEKEELHPAVLISIFDENTGWAGFMLTRSAGLSVRIAFTLLRPVAVNERLLFVGRPAGIRGNPRSPRFFKAEGAIYSVDKRGNARTVAYGDGEWVILEQYTRQIKKYLIPESDREWIFGRDDTDSERE